MLVFLRLDTPIGRLLYHTLSPGYYDDRQLKPELGASWLADILELVLQDFVCGSSNIGKVLARPIH